MHNKGNVHTAQTDDHCMHYIYSHTHTHTHTSIGTHTYTHSFICVWLDVVK